jgi:hypothetical protein
MNLNHFPYTITVLGQRTKNTANTIFSAKAIGPAPTKVKSHS